MADDSTLFTDVTIITVDPTRRIIRKGCLLVQGSRIAHVSAARPATLPANTRVLSLPGRILIPGLINTHAHLGQSLLRGLAEDLPLHSWLCDRIWPLEAAFEGSDGYVAARLTVAEMLRSGTTCFLEALLTHSSGFDNAARAVAETGIRACLGKMVKSAEPQMVDPRDRDIKAMDMPALLAARAAHHGTCDGRLHVWAACATPRGVPREDFAHIASACRAHGVAGITMHCAEAPRDLPIFREVYGQSPMEFCAATGLIEGEVTKAAAAATASGTAGPVTKTVLAHMVHLDLDVDLPLLAATGGSASVAHNPTSNLKLGSGIAAVPALVAAGVNVGLGTDGAPCNNTYDMLREMHLASVLHRGPPDYDAAAVGSHAALEMATLRGAKALGLDADIGSLEVGKKADLVVLDVRGCWSAPWDPEEKDEEGGPLAAEGLDPVTVVVGTCTGRDVELVMVDGRILVEGGQLVNLDEAALVVEAHKAVKGIRARSGIKATAMPPKWHYE